MSEGPEYIRSLNRGYWRSQILFTAVRLGVFELLARRELTAKEAAKELAASDRGMDVLLAVLVGMGLLVKNGDRFSAGEAAVDCLTKGGAHSLVGMVRHYENLVRCWSELEQCVRTGQPCSAQAKTPEDLAQRRADFMWAMKDNAALVAGEVYEKGGFAASRRLLDVGCGPATFSIEFARRTPSLEVTLVDIAEVISVAMKHVYDAGLTPQFATMAGDFRTVPFGVAQYDTAFVSHVTHMYDAGENRKLLSKVWQALAPSGRVVMHDFVLSDDGVHPVETALFAVNMLVGSCGGRCYSAREMFDWLLEAKFVNPRLVPLQGDTSLIMAEKR